MFKNKELNKKEIFSTITELLDKPKSPLVTSFFEEFHNRGDYSEIIIYGPCEHISIIDEFLLKCNIVAYKGEETLIITVD